MKGLSGMREKEEKTHDWMLRRGPEKEKQSLPFFLHHITSTCKNIHSDSFFCNTTTTEEERKAKESIRSAQFFFSFTRRGPSNNITLYENVILWHNIKKYKVLLLLTFPPPSSLPIQTSHHIYSIHNSIHFIFSLFFSFSHFISQKSRCQATTKETYYKEHCFIL